MGSIQTSIPYQSHLAANRKSRGSLNFSPAQLQRGRMGKGNGTIIAFAIKWEALKTCNVMLAGMSSLSARIRFSNILSTFNNHNLH